MGNWRDYSEAQHRSPERLREVVDLSIKNRVRLWRLKNAVDEKSKLYNQSHALRSEESQCRYSRVATTARSVWPRSFRLLGLSAEECQKNLHVWNDQNDIDLPNGELASVVRSAYQHRLPYRSSRHDALLRRYGLLANDAACQAFVASKAAPHCQSGR
ncbi:MAG: primase C-terminal domain-containing protein [Candidatus Binatia bacterium]